MRYGPYSFSMCEEMDESLYYFIEECKELKELRVEIFGREAEGRD